MWVPLEWLSAFCDAGLDAPALAELLASTGTEVERVSSFGVPTTDGNLELFRVGSVETVDPHPNADRLRVCQVELGESASRTIVCGAPNVVEGMRVAVALPGARLADGRRIKDATIRGIESAGMILSEAELGVGTDESGVLALDDTFTPGETLSERVAIGDDVLELEVTPNRPDLFSIYGVAREVHAVTGAPLAADPSLVDASSDAFQARPVEEFITVEVEEPDLCPRFTARVLTDVTVGESPLWLKARLTAAGQRPINNVVDATNYVMLEIGRPMHAYDLAKVAGGRLVVRRPRDGETLKTLDGEIRAFDSDMVVTADDEGVSGIAGIMGGRDSEVDAGTKSLLLEAAAWDGPNILATSKRLGLRSEAGTRFEKQLDSAGAGAAQRLASRMMVNLCGARLAEGTVDIGSDDSLSEVRLDLRPERVGSLLGGEIPESEMTTILGRLGFGVEADGGRLSVVVPSFRRHDVRREIDLIEEVTRVYGLENLPGTLPRLEGAVGGLTDKQRMRRGAEDFLAAVGFNEVVTWSFVDRDTSERLMLPPDDERRRTLALANPMSREQSVMRTTLLPGLMDVALRNISGHADHVRLFESGRVFLSNGQERLPEERDTLAVLMAADFTPKTWRSPTVRPDFYMAKSVLVALLGRLKIEWRLAEGGPAFLHPGKAAQVLCGAHEAGWIGEIHPLVARRWGLKESPVGFEIDLGTVLDRRDSDAMFDGVISFPAVYQDIAVVVDEAVEAATVVEAAKAAGGEMLRSVAVRDLFRGDQIGEDRKSLTLRLEFRSSDGTLTENVVTDLRNVVAEELRLEVGALVRE